MPLSWNEIRDRATAFAAEWRHTKDEDADAKSFLDAFFEVFGIRRRKVASFERRVKKLDGRDGYVDMLWKGTLLVEQKSRGKNLGRAYQLCHAHAAAGPVQSVVGCHLAGHLRRDVPEGNGTRRQGASP